MVDRAVAPAVELDEVALVRDERDKVQVDVVLEVGRLRAGRMAGRGEVVDRANVSSFVW